MKALTSPHKSMDCVTCITYTEKEGGKLLRDDTLNP